MNDIQNNAIDLIEQKIGHLVNSKVLELHCRKYVAEFADKKKIGKFWSNPLFHDLYAHKIQSVIFNIQQNPEIIETFVAKEIPYKSCEELNPSLWNKIIEKKKIQEKHLEEKPAPMTNEFKCGKCHKRDCIYEQRQIRSCDEPMTLFVTCIHCKHNWRM
jgi:transcription elongation factor S-II